jgi:predicted MPP superfamily phosphohydrolase
MEANLDKELLVLCGHTHGEGEAQILPNLKVLTAGAEYGKPRLQGVIEV